jgi:hypothetical protein
MPSGWPHPSLFPPEVNQRRDKDEPQGSHKTRGGGLSALALDDSPAADFRPP